MIYIQAVLYLIKEHWKKLIITVLIVATIILALMWSSTQKDIYYYIGVGIGLTTLLAPCIMYAPEISKTMDKLGLKEIPEDETERSF